MTENDYLPVGGEVFGDQRALLVSPAQRRSVDAPELDKNVGCFAYLDQCRRRPAASDPTVVPSHFVSAGTRA